MADDLRAVDFELGLPSPSDLTPLSQSLITPELASAFGIIPDPSRIFLDLNKASHATYSMICPKEDNFEPPLKLFPSKNDCDENLDEPGSNRAVKRPRLVWTPQLHKRFVDVIEHLGIEKAVPKTIMEMMNVEGLTRENVASHLQKYRLYLKRNEGVVTSHDGHSTSTPRRGSSFLECCDSVSLMMPLPMMGQGNGGFGFRPLGMSVGDSVNSGLFWN